MSSGYQDSGADIAYVLQNQANIDVVTQQKSPDPQQDSGWCFLDNEDGILDAIGHGATHLWANTILFASHPLQASARLDKYQKELYIVGQPPALVDKFDDKEISNKLLRAKGLFTMPHLRKDPRAFLLQQDLSFPIVGKPIRGRGSHGVKVCYSFTDLYDHLKALSYDSPIVMLEQYLSGEEATITVMPPSREKPRYWAMPTVTRFHHESGVAPYNGVVAVTANSRALTQQEYDKDEQYGQAAKECEDVAELLQVTAPIRIDIRRFNDEPGAKFTLFDTNMKPRALIAMYCFHLLIVMMARI